MLWKYFENVIQAWLINKHYVIQMSWILSYIIHETLLFVIQLIFTVIKTKAKSTVSYSFDTIGMAYQKHKVTKYLISIIWLHFINRMTLVLSQRKRWKKWAYVLRTKTHLKRGLKRKIVTYFQHVPEKHCFTIVLYLRACL